MDIRSKSAFGILQEKDEPVQNTFVAAGLQALSTMPTPGPGNDGLRPGLSADQVTPGFLGFLMTAFMVIAVVMLMVSMTRRIRRVRYQAQFTPEQDSPDVPDVMPAIAGEPETSRHTA